MASPRRSDRILKASNLSMNQRSFDNGRPRLSLVVPCYNEEARLRSDAFVTYAQSLGPTDAYDISIMFVDDGSSDDTMRVLRGIEVSCFYTLRFAVSGLQSVLSVT